MNRTFSRILLGLASLGLTISATNAATLSVRVDQDTYNRTDGGTPANGNADTDNELLVGRDDELRPLLGFDVSQITDDVANIGGGDWSNLTITTATLTIYERRGGLLNTSTGNNTGGDIHVSSYDFNFVDSTSTWAAPGAGDGTAGGTLGTSLGSFTLAWGGAADNEDASIALDNVGMITALQNSATTGTLNLIISSSGYSSNPFHSITSDRSAVTSRHALLDVEYSVVPEPSALTFCTLVVGLALVRRRRIQ